MDLPESAFADAHRPFSAEDHRETLSPLGKMILREKKGLPCISEFESTPEVAEMGAGMGSIIVSLVTGP